MAQKGAFLGYNALLGDGSYVENRPSKWQQTWDILGPYITAPVTAPINWTRNMMNASPYTLMTDTGPQAQALVEGSTDVAANFAGGSSFVPKSSNSVGIFGGRLAKTADHAALAKAEEMAAGGAQPKDIYAATGWFKGADQNWRFEIPDHKYFVMDEPDSTIGWKVNHPQLFKAYPELRDMLYNESDLGGAYGQYWKGNDADTGELLKGISTDTGLSKDQRRSTMIHELQHAVQDLEGFERGSNPAYSQQDARSMAIAIEQTPEARAAKEANTRYDDMRGQISPVWKSTYLDSLDRMIERPSLKPRDIFRMGDWYSVSDQYRGNAGAMPKRPGPARDEWLRGAAQSMKENYLLGLKPDEIAALEAVQKQFPSARDRKNAAARLERQLGKFASGSREWMRIRDKIDDLNRLDAFDAYKRSIGETEARNVQTRLKMTPEELAVTPPWQTQDFGMGSQIARVPSPSIVRSILNYREK